MTDTWSPDQLEHAVPGLAADVVEDVGPAASGIDEAYRTKYARYGDSAVGAMVAPAAAATTLRLSPERPETS